MNIALATLLFIAVAITSTSGTSTLNCAKMECSPDTCPKWQCSCGSYKDMCNCCDICYKCPGEECNVWILNLCTEGHECVLQDPEKAFEVGGVGHCKPINATDASETC
ncbi:8.6 kDa transglutaminase substrate-like [Dermacentor albipictus]|uniref:8.6 kDa transglutaminase substrate-like n=1 Tax=Dermacentor albipictus TaxID=60249 RepID=UPI0038FC4E4F